MSKYRDSSYDLHILQLFKECSTDQENCVWLLYSSALYFVLTLWYRGTSAVPYSLSAVYILCKPFFFLLSKTEYLLYSSREYVCSTYTEESTLRCVYLHFYTLSVLFQFCILCSLYVLFLFFSSVILSFVKKKTPPPSPSTGWWKQ